MQHTWHLWTLCDAYIYFNSMSFIYPFSASSFKCLMLVNIEDRVWAYHTARSTSRSTSRVLYKKNTSFEHYEITNFLTDGTFNKIKTVKVCNIEQMPNKFEKIGLYLGLENWQIFAIWFINFNECVSKIKGIFPNRNRL